MREQTTLNMVKHRLSAPFHDQRGQVVLLILLVIVVGLTIAISIAGSSLNQIEETAVTEESNRAFSAAEAGVEETLLYIEQGTPAPQITPNTSALTSGSSVKQVTIAEEDSLTISQLNQDDVAQLDLDCPSCASGNITVTWDSNTAIVITKISGTDPNYTVERWAYNCDFDPGNNFTLVSSGSASQCTRTIAVNGTTDKVLRIRALYANTSLAVSPQSGGVLPAQTTVITSTGQSGDAERTVKVERSAPVPPAILDYVLFSASDSLAK